MLESRDIDAALGEAARLLNSSSDYDLFLAFLRKRSFGKLESIKALISATGMSLGEAKQTVHNSRIWQDRFTGDEKFQASLAEALDRLA